MQATPILKMMFDTTHFLSVFFFSIDSQNSFDGSTNSPGYSVICKNPGLFKFWADSQFPSNLPSFSFGITVISAISILEKLRVYRHFLRFGIPFPNFEHSPFTAQHVVLWSWFKKQSANHSTAVPFSNPKRPHLWCRSTLGFAKNNLGK